LYSYHGNKPFSSQNTKEKASFNDNYFLDMQDKMRYQNDIVKKKELGVFLYDADISGQVSTQLCFEIVLAIVRVCPFMLREIKLLWC